MSLLRDIRIIKKDMKEIKKVLIGENELTDLEKIYRDYKFFADNRGEKLLGEQGLLDEYNQFMNECENILFGGSVMLVDLKIEIPKPSLALEKFKDRFKKFF